MLQQRRDHVVAEAARRVGRPRADHALREVSLAKRVHEGDVVGDAQLLEVVEDRKLGRPVVIDAPAQMVEIVAEQVIVGAAQEALRLARPGVVRKPSTLMPPPRSQVKPSAS